MNARVNQEIIRNEAEAAARYYIGRPDGDLYKEKDFPAEVTNAKKAYISINTAMGNDTSERDRFNERKKQTPGLFTPLGVKNMVSLYVSIFRAAKAGSKHMGYETVRACRQTEVTEGTFFVGPFTSTTKLSVKEIMELGYGNKNGLAICRYNYHDGAIVFDMEEFFGNDYPKAEEREVLILPGTKLVARCSGYDDRYLGKDNKPALVYDIDVYEPEFIAASRSVEELEEIVYNENTLRKVQQFYTALNDFESGFPTVPDCYPQWKACFKELVFSKLSELT